MPIRVQMPDGKVAEFPDGMSPAEIEQALSSEAPSAPADDTSVIGRMLGLGQMRRIDSAIKDRQQNPRELPDDLKFSLEQEMATAGSAGGPVGSGIGAGVGALLEGKGPSEAAASAALNFAVPKAVGKGMEALGGFVKNKAVPMVSAAVKPSIGLLRRRAGIEGGTPAGVGKRIANTILKEGLRTGDDAHALVGKLEEGVQSAVNNAGNKKLDIATRIPRYIGVLARRVENQMTPGRDRAAIQNFGRELIEDSPLSARTGETPVADPSLETALIRILNEARNMGKPALRAEGVTGPSASFRSGQPRALRADVTPAEGLKVVRAKSFFDKDASGASIAAGKTAERAVRDSVKQAAPEAAPLLRRQGQALDAANVLDAMDVRTASRDGMSLPGIVGAAPALANNKVPLLGMLAQFMRNNQMKMGHAAYKYGPKMQRGAAPTGESVRAALMALLADGEQ